MKLYLKPVGLGAENLNLITFDSNNDGWSIVLGRNVATGLDSPCQNIQYVSRNHIKITVRGGRVYLSLVTTQKSVVYLNRVVFEEGECELAFGDTISMLGSLSYFNYKYTDEISTSLNTSQTGKIIRSTSLKEPSKTVEIPMIDLSGGASSPARVVAVDAPVSAPVVKSPVVKAASTAVAASSSSGAATVSHDVINKLIRQYECSICYETMACAFSLAPCGDSFCYTCISDWSLKNNSCPMCQSAFNLNYSMPNKIVDNGIREILSTDKSMLKEWEDRVSEGLAAWKASLQQQQPQQQSKAAVPAAPARTGRDESTRTVILDLFDVVGSSSKKMSNKRGRDGGSNSDIVDLTDSQPANGTVSSFFKRKG